MLCRVTLVAPQHQQLCGPGLSTEPLELYCGVTGSPIAQTPPKSCLVLPSLHACLVIKEGVPHLSGTLLLRTGSAPCLWHQGCSCDAQSLLTGTSWSSATPGLGWTVEQLPEALEDQGLPDSWLSLPRAGAPSGPARGTLLGLSLRCLLSRQPPTLDIDVRVIGTSGSSGHWADGVSLVLGRVQGVPNRPSSGSWAADEGETFPGVTVCPGGPAVEQH